MSDELDNIKIVPGKNLPYHVNERQNCQFNYIEFKDVESRQFSYNPEASETGREKLMRHMKGKQALLWIRTIGDTGGLGGDDHVGEILSPTDKEKYRDLPCCFQSPYGTLVPQVIVPTRRVIDNGLVFPVEASSLITQSRKEGGYDWTPELFVLNDFYGEGEAVNTEAFYDCAFSDITYGVRSPLYRCITNENSQNNMVDHDIFATRKYNCDTSAGAAGTGSCAICHKIIYHNKVGEGNTNAQKELGAMIKIQLAGRMNNQGGTGNSNTIGAIINQAGEIIGVVNGNHVQGSLPEPSSDIMPPHCVRDADEYDLKPLFMYPLYSGFVMTNSVVGNLKDGNAGVFVPYDDEIFNPIYTARVNNVNKSNEINNMQSHDDTSELMKWFPTLYQESDSKHQIKIKVPRSEKVNISDNVSLDFYKCLGRFAYCPIFFHRSIKITLYFKGEYRNPDARDIMDKSYGIYYFYPVVCANVGDNTIDEWSGINSDGADCIYGSNVRWVANDDNLQESIYAVDFEFYANRFQRYPIEIFGAVAVYERHDFQFPVNTNNGSFVFDKPVLDMFTGFVEEQDKFDRYLIEDPDTGAGHKWGGDKKLFGLIQNVSVSASLDGVSGSMTLDGYPLKQGLKVYKQDQSIGEIDLAVEQNGQKYNLFSGYGMELATTDSDNNYTVGVNLAGINRKLEDMRIICAPFWDGDRLEMICAYFEEYAKIQIRMIDHTVTKYDDAKYVSTNLFVNGEGRNLWKSDSHTIVNSVDIAHPAFRVPRSCDWRSPAVNFPTGTFVMEALKDLGKMTGCVCVPQLDGSITYYELNNLGFPFYVNNQTDIVEFEPSEIVSISMQPQLQNKYNAIATFGFLQRKNPEGKILADGNIEFGSFFSKTSELSRTGVQFPWSRQSVGVESAMLTKWELAEIHQNRVKMMTADIYLGNMTVRGNTKVNHIYQRIRVDNQEFFVTSIEHSLDLSSKVWTTSYQLQCINRNGNNSGNINDIDWEHSFRGKSFENGGDFNDYMEDN